MHRHFKSRPTRYLPGLSCLAGLLLWLAGLSLALAAAPASGWRSLDDLRTGRIGYVTGMVFDGFLHQHYPEAKLPSFNNPSDLIQALKSGKVDAAVLARISSRAVVQANPDLAILDDHFMSFPLGIGFRQDRDTLRERFDRYLARIRADGRYETIHRRWFVDDPEQAVMPDLRPPSPRERYVLAVAVADLPYIAYKDGRYIGFDIEILQSWAADENFDLQIQALDFGALLPSIAAGKADIIADGLAITEERRKAVDFSAPYGEEQGAAIVLAANLTTPGANPAAERAAGAGLQTLADLARVRIGVPTGTTMDLYATRHYPEAEIIRFNSRADLVLSLSSGKTDAILTDEVAAKTMILPDNPQLAILNCDFDRTDIAAAFQRGDDELRRRFDAFVQAGREDGTLAGIAERWLVPRPSDVAMPDIPQPTEGRTLRVGVAQNLGLPSISVANGRQIGMEAEVALRFAAREGFQLKFVPMEFDGLIAALTVGKIDMIVSDLSVTEERKKSVDFSLPYAAEQMAALVRSADLHPARRPAGATPGSASGDADPHPEGLLDNLRDSFHSTFFKEQRWRLIVEGLWTTVVVSVLSTLLGTVLGALICYLRMSSHWLLSAIGRSYIGLVRGLPVLLLLMLIFYVVFARLDINPILVAIIAFGMNFAAYVAEMFRSGVEGVDRGQFEAGIAMGFTRVQTFFHIILPQAIRRILPVFRGEFISLVKMTSIVGYIGVQDLTKASDIIRSRTFEAFFPLVMVAVIYFVVIWVLGLALDAIDRRTDPERRRRVA
jgi:polar amino acid transport system substrate-binding protein